MTSTLSTKLRTLDLERARRDPAYFVHRMKGFDVDPNTGRRDVAIATVHQRWHDACSTHGRLVLWAPIDHGKTEQLSIGRVVWELGKNPAHSILVVSASGKMAEKIGGAIRREIEANAYVRQVFPDLKPSTGRSQKWGETAFRVAGAPPGQKDPSVQVAGVGGPILGARLSLLLADDVLTVENTLTAYQRAKVTKWFLSTAIGRVKPSGRAWVVGNAWYSDDLAHTLVKKHGFHGIRDAAYRELTGKPTGTPDAIDPTTLLWPERRIKAEPGEPPMTQHAYMRAKAEDLDTLETGRQLLSKTYSQGQHRFEQEWFDKALEEGRKIGLKFLHSFTDSTWTVFGGCDLGAGEVEGSDETSFFVIAVHNDTKARWPIWVQTERLTGPKIIDTLVELSDRYGCAWEVENNAAQTYIDQFARERGVRSHGFQTGKNKADPRTGVFSLSTELANGQWILPDEPEIHAWNAECVNWSPNGGHVGDRLMASWFAREGSRLAAVVLQGEDDKTDAEPTTFANYSRAPRGRYLPQSARPSRPRAWARGHLRIVS